MKKIFIKCVLVSVSLSLGVSVYAMHPGGNPDGTGPCGKCFQSVVGCGTLLFRICSVLVEAWRNRGNAVEEEGRANDWKALSIQEIRDAIQNGTWRDLEGRSDMGVGNVWHFLVMHYELTLLMDAIVAAGESGDYFNEALTQTNILGQTPSQMGAGGSFDRLLLLWSIMDQTDLDHIFEDNNFSNDRFLIDLIRWMQSDVVSRQRLNGRQWLDSVIKWLNNDGKPQGFGRIKSFRGLVYMLGKLRTLIEKMPFNPDEFNVLVEANTPTNGITWIDEALETLSLMVAVLPPEVKRVRDYSGGGEGGDGSEIKKEV